MSRSVRRWGAPPGHGGAGPLPGRWVDGRRDRSLRVFHPVLAGQTAAIGLARTWEREPGGHGVVQVRWMLLIEPTMRWAQRKPEQLFAGSVKPYLVGFVRYRWRGSGD